jgi:hypothetical protein
MKLLTVKNIIFRPKNYVFIILIFFLCLACYSRIPFLQFQSHWDDQWVIHNWYTEGGFSIENIKSIFVEYYHGQYSPVNQIYYTTLYFFWGYNPIAFHIGGLILHLINVFLVYKLILKSLVVLRLETSNNAMRIAFLTCSIFAVHPLLVEPTAWVSASKVLIYAIFYLLSLIMYLNYLNTTDRKYLVYTLIYFIVSFLAKEQAVTLPVTLLLLDYLFFSGMLNRKIWLIKMPFFCFSIIFGILTMQSQAEYNQGILSDSLTYPLIYRICYAFYAMLEYTIKCLIPIGLSYHYYFPNTVTQPLPTMFFIYPILIPFIIYGFWQQIKVRWITFGLFLFIINIVLVLHIIPIARVAIIADRYVYVGSIGVFFLISYCVNILLLKKTDYKIFVWICLILYIGYLGCYTYSRVPYWYNSESLKKKILTCR